MHSRIASQGQAGISNKEFTSLLKIYANGIRDIRDGDIAIETKITILKYLGDEPIPAYLFNSLRVDT
jgi:hypothetical protein